VKAAVRSSGWRPLARRLTRRRLPPRALLADLFVFAFSQRHQGADAMTKQSGLRNSYGSNCPCDGPLCRELDCNERLWRRLRAPPFLGRVPIRRLLTPFDLALDCFPQQVRSLLAPHERGVDTRQRPCRESSRHLLVVYSPASHVWRHR
jgi:hypothetical protein